MELSIREAATLLHQSPRTVRDRAARGDLPAQKRDGHWVIRSEHLPLDARQQRAVQARADELRAALDAALPGRAAATPGGRVRISPRTDLALPDPGERGQTGRDRLIREASPPELDRRRGMCHRTGQFGGSWCDRSANAKEPQP